MALVQTQDPDKARAFTCFCNPSTDCCQRSKTYFLIELQMNTDGDDTLPYGDDDTQRVYIF